MPYQKRKSENYQNFAGINSKFSPYVTSPMEFLELINLDFQTPGSLTHRWGSTQYVGQTFPGPINSLFEFSKLDGTSQVVISYSGGIFAGATTGNSQGLSFTVHGATIASYSFFPNVSHQIAPNLATLSIGLGNQGVPFLGIEDKFAGSSQIFINPPVQSDNTLSYTTLNNFLFMADGNKFVKYDGVTTLPVGLPPPMFAFGNSPSIGSSTYLSNISGASDFLGLGMTGTYVFYASYVNNRGFEGPLWPILSVQGGSFINGTSASAIGLTYIASRIPIATPLQYGISAINLYCYWGSSLFLSNFGNGDNKVWLGYNGLMTLMNSFPASGSTFAYVLLGSTVGGQSLIQSNLGRLAPTTGYQPLGLTIVAATNVPYSISSEVDIVSFYPRILDTYQNRLMLAGFSTAPSTVWFSDVGEPEGYAPNFNFDVRTNDGDFITGMKSYGTKFYIFKNNSFHVLVGDNPNNFLLQQISDQYGCVNNRCAITYDDILLFLDVKGVIQWNGANVQNISNKIQPTIDQMNVDAAKTKACAVHDKLRNQVLFAIPINGSSTNNVTLVYDYLLNGWTKQDGYSPSVFAAIRGRNNSKNVFYGDYSGRVNWFGPSFLADNGVGFTTYLKTRFLHDMGDSTQKTFRRLYLNVDSPASSTLVFKVNFFQDYGSSVVLGTSMILSQFQNRIDFGIPAKSIAFEMSNIQTTIPLKIHGFTVESRFLRGV